MTQTAEPTSSPPPGAKPRKSPWKRWTFRLGVGLVILLAIVLACGQIIFSTDIPRDIVVRAVEKSLGLRVTAKSLSTGWLGRSTMHDVTFSLPLSDKTFISIPELRLRHTPLPWLLLTGSFDINDIALDQPTLDVHQPPGGEWNFLEVLQLLGRALGGNPQKPQTHDIPVLPDVHVSNGTFVLTDAQNRSATLEHLSIEGISTSPLVWQYHLSVPDRLDIDGKVAPGGQWFHEFDIQAQNLQLWLKPWIASLPASAHFQAHWSGRIDDGRLAGRMDIVSANFGNIAISGPADVVAFNGPTTVHPAGISISNSPSKSPVARLDDGLLVIGSEIEARQLLVACANGHATLDGQFALGRPSFNAVIDGRGTLKAGQWDIHVALNGNGVSYDSLSMSLAAQTLRFEANNGKAIDLSGLAADFSSYSGGVALQELKLGNLNAIFARGGYDFSHDVAWLNLDGRSISLPTSEINSLDFDLNIWSNSQRVHLQQLFLRSDVLSASLAGDYVFKESKPFKAHLAITQMPPSAINGAAAEPFRGSLQCGIDLQGTAAPLDLSLVGYANGSDLFIDQRPLGDPKLKLSGQVHDGQVSLLSNDIELLGGTWNVSGHWPVDNGLFHMDNLSVQHLSLAQALADNNLAGTLDGKWSVDVRQLTTHGVEVEGSSTISGLTLANHQSLSIDEIQMPSVQISNGFISLFPITLVHKDPAAVTQAQAGLWTTIAHPSQLTLYLNADSWPLRNSARTAAALISAKANLDIDLARKSAIGHVALRVDGYWQSKAKARLDAAVDIYGRRIEATDIRIQGLQGTASGQGIYDFDHFDDARLKLDWKDLDLADLDQISPDLNGIHGKINGSLRISAATTPRPLEPLAVDLRLNSNAVRIGNFTVGDARVAAYLGPHRIVLDDAPQRRSQVQIAGGILGVWGRVSQPVPGLYQSLVELNLENLSLDALLPSGAKANRTPGQLSGRITVVGRPGNEMLSVGQGNLSLTHADLAGAGPIAFLYNLMHLSHDPNRPVGSGTVSFSVQDENLYITALRYFDRGSEIRLSGDILNLLKIPHCPIDMVAVGSVRPFTSIDIPGLADIDQALSAVQHDAISIEITGHLDHPQRKAIPFSDIGQDMRNLLFGDVKAANQ
jgi:hypothetical protein